MNGDNIFDGIKSIVLKVSEETVNHPWFAKVDGESDDKRLNRVTLIVSELMAKSPLPPIPVDGVRYIASNLIKKYGNNSVAVERKELLVSAEEAKDIVDRSIAASKITLDIVDESERVGLMAELARGNVERFGRMILCECHYEEKIAEVGEMAFNAVMAGLGSEEYKRKIISFHVDGNHVNLAINGLLVDYLDASDIESVRVSFLKDLPANLKEKGVNNIPEGLTNEINAIFGLFTKEKKA